MARFHKTLNMMLYAFVSKLNIDTKVKTVPVTQDIFAEGIGFSIGNEVIAEFGTIKKSVLKQFKLLTKNLILGISKNP
jgi:phenylalanyl-tRNA synthetase beta chain